MNEKPIFRRTQFFLRNSSQPRLLLGIEIIFLILLIVSTAIFYLIANRDLATTYALAHMKIRNVQEILLPTLIAINLGGLILGAVLILFFTHRIAGPAYRLSRILRAVGDGNLQSAIRFRQGDELRELETATTEMLAGLNARVARVQTLAHQTRVLADAAPGDDLRALRATVATLEKELDEFQLDVTVAREPAQ